jgi:ribosomal protein L21
LLNYYFEIVKATPLKGHKIEGAKDYATKVRVEKDEKILFDEVIVVRKNKEGVFPDLDMINKKIAAASTRRELTEKIKEYFKHQK